MEDLVVAIIERAILDYKVAIGEGNELEKKRLEKFFTCDNVYFEFLNISGKRILEILQGAISKERIR